VCRSPSYTDGEPVWRIVKRECIVRRATAVRNWVSPIVKRFRAFFGEGYKSNGCFGTIHSRRPTLQPATRGGLLDGLPVKIVIVPGSFSDVFSSDVSTLDPLLSNSNHS